MNDIADYIPVNKIGNGESAFLKMIQFKVFKETGVAGEMAQRFRALAIPENTDSTPNTLLVPHNHPKLQFQGIGHLSQITRHQVHAWCTHVYGQAKHSHMQNKQS